MIIRLFLHAEAILLLVNIFTQCFKVAQKGLRFF